MISFIVFAAGAIAVGVLLTLRARAPRERLQLIHGPASLIIGASGFTLFAGAALLFLPNPTTTWWTTAGFCAFALLSLWGVLAYFTEDIRVSRAGIKWRGPFGARKSMRWEDVRHIGDLWLQGGYRVRSYDGAVVRVSYYLEGLEDFAKLAWRHVPDRFIAHGAAQTLRESRGRRGANPNAARRQPPK